MILTHPNNRKLLEEGLRAGRPDPLDDGLKAWGLDPLLGLPVRFTDTIPERNTRQDWHPPEGSRFCDYGPEDEAWMRPLGLGRIETVDLGPLFYDVPDFRVRDFWSPMFLPRSTFLSSFV